MTSPCTIRRVLVLLVWGLLVRVCLTYVISVKIPERRRAQKVQQQIDMDKVERVEQVGDVKGAGAVGYFDLIEWDGLIV
ncbi:hypothetical protein AFCA_001131 [Aspergillus flavus]|nr:hypothetical protein AFCA_001131 [Aspergillus flavus]